MLRSCVVVWILAGLAPFGPSGCGCEAEPRTAIMVEVDSDIPLAALDRVRLQVDSVEDGGALTNRLDVEYRLAARAEGDPGGSVPGASEVRLPIRIAVLPRRSDDGAIHLRASGLPPGADAPSVLASARLTFVPDRTLLLRLPLVEACVGVTCPEGQTCAEVGGQGLCVDEEIDRPECTLEDLEAGRVEGCASACELPADCDDGSACTTDGCRDGACTHEPACGGATPVCCGGICKACCADGDCDDGVDCTDDTCAAGACSHESTCGCQDDLECGGGHCCAGACKGCCDASDCDDGDGCTDDTCEAGACRNATRVCPPGGDPCVTFTCQGGQCMAQPVCGAGEVCCGGACNTECCVEADCPNDSDCAHSVCQAGRCNQLARPDGTDCPGGVCEHATATCVECLTGNDCGSRACQSEITCTTERTCTGTPLPDRTVCAEGEGTMCCGGACVQCCDDLDCVGAVDACADPRCVEGRCIAEGCLPNGTPCGQGLSCDGCSCQ